MKRLLLPVVGLMNRLSYLQKFILVSLVFMIPLLVLSLLQLDAVLEARQQTARKLQALAALQRSVEVAQRLGDYRDLRVLSGVAQGATAATGSFGSRLSHIEQRIGATLDGLTEHTFTFDRDGKLRTETEQLARLWRQRQETPAYNQHVSQDFAHNQPLVAAAWRLAERLADLSGLSQDGDRVNFALLRTLLHTVPDLHEQLGRARVYGTYVLRVQRIDSLLANQLEVLYERLGTGQRQLAVRLQDITGGQVAVAVSLAEIAEQALGRLRQAHTRLDEAVIMDETLNTPWHTYLEAVDQDLATLTQLTQQMLGRVETHLRQRLQQQQRQLTTLWVALPAVLLLAGYLYLGFNVSVRDNINRLLAAAKRLAQGDLTAQIPVRAKDELGELTQAFNRMVEQMHAVIGDVRQTTAAVAAQVQAVDEIAQQSRQAALQQQRQTEQIADSMQEMAASVQQVSQTTLDASEATHTVNGKADNGHRLVQATLADIRQLAGEIDHSMQAINRLAEDSAQITRVLDVIKGVAEQTNLLALNAAIEAARAGEQGRGFAVVADEVRTLASRTHQSTEEIEQMIANLQAGVNDTVTAMDHSQATARQTVSESVRVGEALSEIARATDAIAALNAQIASATEQQAATAQTIDQNTLAIGAASAQTVQGAERTVQACRQLATLSAQLQERVASFQV